MDKVRILASDEVFVARLTDIVLANLHNEQFGVEELAREAGYSRFTIYRRLLRLRGQTITDFINEIRLSKALELLTNTDDTASEIAYQVGFNNPSYFSKAFKRRYNATPGEIRQSATAAEHTPVGEKQHDRSDFAGFLTRRWWVYVALVLLVAALTVGRKILVNKGQKEAITSRAKTAHKNSIAVLPLDNLSNDTEQEYFVDGVMDEVINHLYKIGGLKVISRTTSLKYRHTDKSTKAIAHELGVAYLLEGSVRKSENDVRITIQLIDGKTDTQLWSETYAGNLSDIFSIQEQVARQVAKELKLAITNEGTDLAFEKKPTTSTLAYDLYLKGNYYWSSYDVDFEEDLAMLMYSKGIEEDPDFALAYGKRAMMHLFQYWHKRENWQEHKRLGLKDLKKALHLDPQSVEINFVEAVASYWLERDYEKALSQLTELKRKVPNMADLYAFTSYVLRRQGKNEAAKQELKYALELDPLNENFYHNLFQTFDITHQYDSLLYYAEKAHSQIPDFNRCTYIKAHALLKRSGNYTLVLREWEPAELLQSLYTYLHNRKVDYPQMLNHRLVFEDIQNQYKCIPRQFQWAYLYYLHNDSTHASIYLDSAVDILRSKIATEGDQSIFYATLGRCYAMQGNTAKAYEMGHRAVALQPIQLDAFLGPRRIEELMEIDIIAGNYDDALDKIEYLLSNPSWLSVGDLLLYKRYDKLRDHPRFGELLVKFVHG